MHRPLQIGPVYGDIALDATLDCRGRPEAELVVVVATESDGPRAQGVQKLLAVRVPAATRRVCIGPSRPGIIESSILRPISPGWMTLVSPKDVSTSQDIYVVIGRIDCWLLCLISHNCRPNSTLGNHAFPCMAGGPGYCELMNSAYRSNVTGIGHLRAKRKISFYHSAWNR